MALLAVWSFLKAAVESDEVVLESLVSEQRASGGRPPELEPLELPNSQIEHF